MPATAKAPTRHPHHDFWQGVKKKTAEGWENMLPDNPAQMGREGLADILRGLIDYLPVTIRWEGRELTASLDNGQNSMDLESGGFIPNGAITLYLSKESFGNGDLPETDDEIAIISQGKWVTWLITSVSETFDEADPALIIIAEGENA